LDLFHHYMYVSYSNTKYAVVLDGNLAICLKCVPFLLVSLKNNISNHRDYCCKWNLTMLSWNLTFMGPTSGYISIVKPTRYMIFRVYWISHYIFRTVCPSIIRSPRLYIQHHVYVIQVLWLLANGHEMISISSPLPSSPRTCMTYTWCCMYSIGLLMIDGKTVRNM